MYRISEVLIIGKMNHTYNTFNTYVRKGGPLRPNISFFASPVKTRKEFSPLSL